MSYKPTCMSVLCIYKQMCTGTLYNKQLNLYQCMGALRGINKPACVLYESRYYKPVCVLYESRYYKPLWVLYESMYYKPTWVLYVLQTWMCTLCLKCVTVFLYRVRVIRRLWSPVARRPCTMATHICNTFHKR